MSIAQLKGKQSALKGKLTSIDHQLTDHATTPLTADRYHHIKKMLGEYSEKAEILNDEIYALADAAEQATQQQETDAIDAKIRVLIDRLAKIDDPGRVGTPQSGPDVGIRLPKLEVPTFSGEIQDWTSFHDLFVATIHNSTRLSKAHKLQYLKSSLKGNAANIIQSLQITDANYDEAWALLTERFSNQREIVHAHLKRLFGQPFIKEESHTALRGLVDTTQEVLRALKVLQRPVDQWDDLVVFLVTERIDSEARRQWILSLTTNTPPNLKDLLKFLDQRTRALMEAGEGTKVKQTTTVKTSGERQKSTAVHHGAVQDKCITCSGIHPLYRCTEFSKLAVPERKKLVQKHALCFNCFRGGHDAAHCTSGSCKKCQAKHNTLIHIDNSTVGSSSQALTALSSGGTRDGKVVLLATAIVNVTDGHGNLQRCRVLLDNAAEASLITEQCVRRLGLPKQRSNSSVTGVGDTRAGTVRSMVHLKLSSLVNPNFSINLEALMLQRVTGVLPSTRCEPSTWSHIKPLQLADPTFHQPGQIDILLAADIYAEVLRPGLRHGKKGLPPAVNTTLGWVISGGFSHKPATTVTVNHVQCDVDSTLRRFWELEELPDESPVTVEEKACELQFSTTHSRTDDGRFMVCLPFSSQVNPLGASRDIALRRLKQMERRFQSNPELKSQYVNFMREYETLGHMEKIPQHSVQEIIGSSYYMPHHAVRKDNMPINKFRVVFDASAKSTTGVSLNDNLMVGPRLQDDLVPILLRFRFHAVALCADVCKMYRQIWVHPSDWTYQRILWREDPSQPVQDYWLKTVTYGTASAPFQAVRCTKQLALDNQSAVPEASAVWLRDSFVDDLMSGESSTAKTITLRRGLNQLMDSGRFPLLKWLSNDPAVLEDIPVELRQSQLPLSIDNDDTVKTLGLHWHPATDVFSFQVFLPPLQSTITKRVILSDMSRVFDPLGWLSPVIIRAKILFQQLWTLDVGWDDQLPENICREWRKYRDDLHNIEKIRIPRFILSGSNPGSDGKPTFQLHGFGDASKVAYSAVVYLRTVHSSGEITVNLMISKTKVAPLKVISIPRLELCAALLLARLLKVVQKSIIVDIGEVWGWSDSTVVLDWLASPSSRWKTFVANRVSEVQDVLSASNWHYVPGKDNPADCASRGVSPSELLNHPLWWHGPPWLKNATFSGHPIVDQDPDAALKEERRTVVTTLVTIKADNSLLSKYSSLTKLQRVTAFCLRFIHNIQSKSDFRSTGPLTVTELRAALHFWIRRVQADEFHDEIHSIITKKQIRSKSRLLPLNPFIDDQGLLRVGGRLHFSCVSVDKKHPILLPKNHVLTNLVIHTEHIRLLHAGPQLLLASLQRQFWIISGRDLIRQLVRRCVTCTRYQGETVQQLMGSLPAPRVNINRAFLTTGVDYAGPFQLRVLKGRGHKQFKAYIALFICFVTRAIHLEAVSDLTSSAFIAALQRFVSRRGKCLDLHSDCGTNFGGANKELIRALKLAQTNDYNETVSRYLTAQGISWHFNPPSAPHQGGLWEAGVKSVKFHLRRIVGNQVLNFEEFGTILTQIEACLNSRPLCPLSTNPDDLSALTPGHFLIGDVLTAIPEPDLTKIQMNRLSRWQLVQRLFQQFWRRWTSEYLSRLQQRPKWWSYRPNLQVGDMVLVKDDNLPPLSWPLGRVVIIHPGADQLVRVVTVKTANSVFKRPVTKLCHLPIERAPE